MKQIILPKHQFAYKLLWKHSNNGALSLKDAYIFKSTHSQHLKWAKAIWSPDIPPSKPLLAWRLMHNKVSTDDQLNLRGFSITSMCSCCRESQETSPHLFLNCKYAFELKIYWIKWETLCKEKKKVGIGFRTFHEYNLAMLSKQGWHAQRRLIDLTMFKSKVFS